MSMIVDAPSMPPVATSPSFWQSTKNVFVNIGNGIAAVAVKVYEFVKSFFVQIGHFFSDHASHVLTATVALGIGAGLYALFSWACRKDEDLGK